MKKPDTKTVLATASHEVMEGFDFAVSNETALMFKKLETSGSHSDWFNPLTLRLGLHQLPFIEREEVDGKIKKALGNNRNIILTGKKGAGKSRAIYEIIHTGRISGDIYLSHFSGPGISSEATSPSLLSTQALEKVLEQSQMRRCYVIIEDLERYAERDEIFHLVERLVRKEGVSVLISGNLEQLHRIPFLMHVLPHEPSMRFIHIAIPEVGKSTVESAIAAYKAFCGEEVRLDRHFDKCIGSIFLQSNKFSGYFLELAYDDIQLEVLWALKCLCFLQGQYVFSKQSIIDFILAGTSYPAPEPSATQAISDALRILDAQNFAILDQEQSAVYIPPIHLPVIAKGYLFDILDNGNIPQESKLEEEEIYLSEDILTRVSLAPRAVKKAVGNAVLQKVQLHYSRHYLFDSVVKMLGGPEYIVLKTYNHLIEKAYDLSEAEAWDRHRQASGLAPDAGTILAFSRFFQDYKGLKGKEEALNISFPAHSLLLCSCLLGKVHHKEEAIQVLTRFSAETLRQVNGYYYYTLISALHGFHEGYEIYALLRQAEVPLSALFYKNLILLEGGQFQQAFDLFVILQEENIALVDHSTLLALARKIATAEDKLILEKELRLFSDALQEDKELYFLLLEKESSILKTGGNGAKAERSYLKNESYKLHQVLIAKDEPLERKHDALQKLVALKEADTGSFKIYLENEFIDYDAAIHTYKWMAASETQADFDIFELIFKKYMAQRPAKGPLPEALMLVYEDLQDLLAFGPPESFDSLSALLCSVITEFDEKINLIEEVLYSKISSEKLEKEIAKLNEYVKTYLQSTKVLDAYYKCKVSPEFPQCLDLLERFLPENPKDHDLIDLVLFFKDLKNCRVQDDSLSRLYLKIIDKKTIDRHILYEDLKSHVRINFSPEALAEAIFLDVHQDHVEATLKLSIKEYFPENTLTEGVVEHLMFYSSNFQSAEAIYKIAKSNQTPVTEKAYKKLMDYAIQERNLNGVKKILSEALADGADYVMPLLTKTGQDKRLAEVHNSFIAHTEIAPEAFKKDGYISVWQNLKAKGSQTPSEGIDQKELLTLIDAEPKFTVALEICKRHVKEVRSAEKRTLKALLKKEGANIEKIFEFFKSSNLNYLEAEMIGDFIQHANDEALGLKIFEDAQKKLSKKFPDPIQFYSHIIYPYYCLLSVATQFDYPSEILRDISGKNANISPVILEKLVLLIDSNEQVDVFLEIANKFKVPLSEPIMDKLIEALYFDNVWKFVEKFKGDIAKFNAPIYSKILSMQAKEKERTIDGFKKLLSMESAEEKFPVIAKFILATFNEFSDEFYQLSLAKNVKFKNFATLVSVIEKAGQKVPESIIDRKITSLTEKTTEKPAKKPAAKTLAEPKKKAKHYYNYLIPYTYNNETLEWILNKLKLNLEADPTVFYRTIMREKDKVRQMKIYELYDKFPNLINKEIKNQVYLKLASDALAVNLGGG